MKQLIIRFPLLPEAPVEWLVRDPAGIRGEPRRGPLSAAAEAAVGASVTVLVPATDVLLTSVTLPSQQRRYLRRAVPFALEEQLASDVERLHFAVGRVGPAGAAPVAVVARERMDAWQARLEAVDLRPHVLLCDVLALPLAAGEWTLLIEADGALLRTGPLLGLAIDPVALTDLLPLCLAESNGQPPTAVRVIAATDLPLTEIEAVFAGAGVAVRSERLAGPVLGLLAKGAGASELNLLQGDYSRREQLGRLWRPWRPAAALLGILLLLQGGMSLQRYFTLQSQAQGLKERVEAVYRDTFPEAQMVVNPRVQMERQVKALQQGGGSSGFTELMTLTAPVIAKAGGVEVTTLRYGNGVLELDLVLGDLQSLDRLKQGLTDAGDLQVDIASAAARGEKVESRLQVRRRGA